MARGKISPRALFPLPLAHFNYKIKLVDNSEMIFNPSLIVDKL